MTSRDYRWKIASWLITLAHLQNYFLLICTYAMNKRKQLPSVNKVDDFLHALFLEQKKSHGHGGGRRPVGEEVQEVWEGGMLRHVPSLLCERLWQVARLSLYLGNLNMATPLFPPSFFHSDRFNSLSLFSGALKTDTRPAGTTCHAVSIFATSVSITTTAGNVDGATTRRTIINKQTEAITLTPPPLC